MNNNKEIALNEIIFLHIRYDINDGVNFDLFSSLINKENFKWRVKEIKYHERNVPKIFVE